MTAPLHGPPQRPGTDALTLALMPDSDAPDAARVSGSQQLLFGLAPRAVCDAVGLNWWTAIKLRAEGWLSFSVEEVERLDEAQEAELRFIGTLVAAGCGPDLLGVLLRGLERPYAYDLNRLYYDWVGRQWRVVSEPAADRESHFAEWLAHLVREGDIRTVRGIAELASEALARLELERTQGR